MAFSNEYGKDLQDAYVFVPSGSEDTMEKLKDLWSGGQVRYATRVLSGGFGAVAFVEAALGDDGLTELREKLTRIRDAVNPGTSVGVALKIGPRAPTRWSQKLKVGAYVRIRTEHGRAGDVFDAVEHLPGYYGSALVLGDWDVMLELGANSFEEMKRLLLEQVNPIAGVEWTDSAIVLNDRDEPDSPGQQ
jgi:DNA-binding Lrp family transcriptional regulator